MTINSATSADPLWVQMNAASTTPTSATAKGTGSGSELGQDAFLQLLVAQLKYQDPSKPADSSQFMAQTAQFTSVEKLTELVSTQAQAAAAQQRLSAGSLVGQQVSWVSPEGGPASGTVRAVRFDESVPVLEVSSGQDVWAVPLNGLTSVGATSSTAAGGTTRTPGDQSS